MAFLWHLILLRIPILLIFLIVFGAGTHVYKFAAFFLTLLVGKIASSGGYFSLRGSGGPERTEFFVFLCSSELSPTNSMGYLDIFGHDGDTFGMDAA